VQRLWREEGLKVPQKQPKRGRLWLDNGSIVRSKPLFPNHFWSYDFVQDRTQIGVKFRITNAMDEFTRECLAVKVTISLMSHHVIEVLTAVFIDRGVRCIFDRS